MAAGLADRPHRTSRTICLPIAEDEYHRIVDQPQAFREWLMQAVNETPELFPEVVAEGFQLKNRRRSRKLNVWLRLIRLRDGTSWSIRPSLVMPGMVAMTVVAVAVATGLSDRTVRTGILELDDPDAMGPGRQRRPGAGRRAKEVVEPDLVAALESIVESSTRGDPVSSLRWTCKSTRSIAEELCSRGFAVSHAKVSQLLRTCGYSLQANRKTIEGVQHPDRSAQFEYINRRIRAFRRTRQPAISVDTKKKEPPGPLKNPGRCYRRKGDQLRVATHDFPSRKLGKAIPYGVYDITNNEAGVTVGISHDTAEFAVTAIQRWWEELGRTRFPGGKRVLLTADCGGSNSPRSRLWRLEMQRLANETGLEFEVCHFPPGTSKWNKIEHRLFCHITRNWLGIPLETLEIVINLIGNASTREALEVHAWLDEGEYPKARKVTDAQLCAVRIQRHSFHGEWNYKILPNTISTFR